MRINVNNTALQSFQNNALTRNASQPFKANGAMNQNTFLNISSESVNQYFNSVFKPPINPVNMASYDYAISKGNTNEAINRYAETFADIFDNIQHHAPDVNRDEYITSLSRAYAKAVDEEADDMIDDMEALFEKFDMEIPLDKKKFKELFKEVSEAIKNYHLENKPGDMGEYIEKHVDFSKNPDIKSYDAFKTVMDLVDTSTTMIHQANATKGMIMNNSPDKLISDDALAILGMHTNGLNNGLNLLSELKDKLNLDELGEAFGKGFRQVMDKQSHNLTDFSGKAQRYQEYLEKYDKLQDDIAKAEAKREAYNEKLDRANQVKDENLVKIYLKQVASMDAQIGALKAQCAEIEAEMAALRKDIASTSI